VFSHTHTHTKGEKNIWPVKLMGYSIFFNVNFSQLLLFHYVSGSLIQYPPAENRENLIASGIRKIKRGIEKEKTDNVDI
jgi:hypothetical protein